MSNKQKKPKANQAVRTHLNEVVRKLEALVDLSEDSSCAVPPEHKKAVKNYIKAWILPRARIARDWAEGEELSYRDKF